ncbi:MAG: hemerythrin domain-containing protein [Betaproteobacteria bacterium]
MAAPSKSKAVSKHDAIALLIADHKSVKALFEQYKKLDGDDGADEKKSTIAESICDQLTVHAQIEEDLFYPAARAAIDDNSLLDEAEVEHATAKDLIEQLRGMTPSDPLFDAKVKVLGEYIDHHVNEEQDELFPKVSQSDLDTAALGAELLERKNQLMSEMGISAEPVSEDIPPPQTRKGKAGTLRVRK